MTCCLYFDQGVGLTDFFFCKSVNRLLGIFTSAVEKKIRCMHLIGMLCGGGAAEMEVLEQQCL